MGTLARNRLIKGMREECEFKISLCYPRGLGKSSEFFREGGGVT